MENAETTFIVINQNKLYLRTKFLHPLVTIEKTALDGSIGLYKVVSRLMLKILPVINVTPMDAIYRIIDSRTDAERKS